MSENLKNTGLTIALAILYGGGITGIAALVVAAFAFFDRDFLGAGICLLAAALSFGLMAYAVLRDGLPFR